MAPTFHIQHNFKFHKIHSLYNENIYMSEWNFMKLSEHFLLKIALPGAKIYEFGLVPLAPAYEI